MFYTVLLRLPPTPMNDVIDLTCSPSPPRAQPANKSRVITISDSPPRATVVRRTKQMFVIKARPLQSKSKAPKPKPKPSPVEKKTTGGSWSEADDQYLWTHQHDGRAALASHFCRTGGGIGARLTHLKNPEHKAYTRRMSGGSQKGGLLTALRGQGVKSVQERFRESRAFGNALKESKVSAKAKENSNSNAQNSLAR